MKAKGSGGSGGDTTIAIAKGGATSRAGSQCIGVGIHTSEKGSVKEANGINQFGIGTGTGVVIGAASMTAPEERQVAQCFLLTSRCCDGKTSS